MPGESISNPENNNGQAWAEAMAPIVNENGLRTEEYENSALGQVELDAEAHYDALEAKLNKAVENNEITEEEANRLLENQLNRTYDSITDVREQYKQNQNAQAEARNNLVNVLQGVRDAKAEEPTVEPTPEPTVEPTPEEPVVESAPEPKTETVPEQTGAEDEFKAKLDHAYEKIDKWLERGDIDEAKAQELRGKVEADLKNKMEAKLRIETAYKNIDNMVKNGQIDEEQAAQYKAQIEEKYKIEDEFQDKMENEAKANEEARLRAEEEAKRRMEAAAEARAKMDEEARAQMDDDAKRQMDDDAAKNQGKAPKETAGLYAINAEALLDRKQILAEAVDKVMEKEISSAHGIKKLFVKLFKNQYRKRIERELREGDRDEYNFAIGGRRVNICRVYGKLAPECIDDILKEKGKDDMLEKADEASTKLVKEAIQEFVEKVNKEGIKGTTKQKEVFEEIMKAKRGGAKQEGVAVDNYAKVALQALELTHHGAAMDKVMEGFKLINVRPKTEREMERTKELEEVAKLVKDSEELLGGKDGMNIIMSGQASEQDTAPDGRYQKWWDSLDNSGKKAAIQILARIDEINKDRLMRNEKTINNGAAFSSWLEANAS